MYSPLSFKKYLARRVLSASDPLRARHAGGRRALKSFHRLRKNSPRYRSFLELCDVEAGQIRNLSDFHDRVPCLSKKSLFGGNQSEALIDPRVMAEVRGISASSGKGELYGFALADGRQNRKTGQMIDLGFALHFDCDQLPTLIINCLSMGLSVASEANTVINLGPRADSALAAAEAFASFHQQVIFLCDPLFAKHLADEARNARLDWTRQRVHILHGGDSSGENFRDYLAEAFSIDLSNAETGSVRASLGLGEVGLNLMFETDRTIALRRQARRDKQLYRRLFGEAAAGPPPMLFAYDPVGAYLEVHQADANGVGELLISNTNYKSPLPLVRYLTGDRVRLVPADGKGVDNKVSWRESCFDRLPLIALYGRQSDFITPELSVLQIKDLLFADLTKARALSGAFTIQHGDEGALCLRIQLKPGCSQPAGMGDDLAVACHELGSDIRVEFVAHDAFGERQGVDFERKFNFTPAL